MNTHSRPHSLHDLESDLEGDDENNPPGLMVLVMVIVLGGVGLVLEPVLELAIFRRKGPS